MGTPLTEVMMEALNSRIKETAKVPFNKEKQEGVLDFFHKLIGYKEALENNSADIKKIIKENYCEKTEAEIRDLALLDYKPEEEFNLEKITKLIMKHPKEETISNQQQQVSNDNKIIKKVHKETIDGTNDSQEENIDEENTEKNNNEDPPGSGVQSFVAVTTLVASLFFL